MAANSDSEDMYAVTSSDSDSDNDSLDENKKIMLKTRIWAAYKPPMQIDKSGKATFMESGNPIGDEYEYGFGLYEAWLSNGMHSTAKFLKTLSWNESPDVCDILISQFSNRTLGKFGCGCKRRGCLCNPL